MMSRFSSLGKTGPTLELITKEFEGLRSELRDAMKETWSVERNAVFAAAVLVGWLFSQHEWRTWMEYAKYMPLTIAAFGGLRCLALLDYIALLIRYTTLVEDRWGQAEQFNWEHFVKTQRKWPLVLVAAFFWFIFLGLTVWFAMHFEASWLLPSDQKH